MSENNSGAKVLIEVCVESVDVAIAAEQAGAHRLELNFGLELDGLTPSPGLVHSVLEAVDIPVIAMARPRSGDFVYSDSDWRVLCKDVTWLIDQGVAGIAFGILDERGKVDSARCAEMRKRTTGVELVFHRAFDVVSDWSTSIERLAEKGIDRIMTSGQKPTAEAGIETIAEMIKQADSRIEILPAAGINSQNAARIIDETGCVQIHGSFSGAGKSPEDVGSEIAALVSQLGESRSSS